MIPILFDEDEKQFLSEGLGRLSDCVSCTVEEERNGTYECEFQYPVNGPMFNQIREQRIIFADHDDSEQGQPFVIYARSEPINGVVTFNAHHISYRLSNEVVMPFTATSTTTALAAITQNVVEPTDFTFIDDKRVAGNFRFYYPKTVREILGGEEDSFLDAFNGGEYEFDKFRVILHNRRGEDTGVEIRYGKNLIDFEHTLNDDESYNAIVPYWYQEEEGTAGTLVTLPEVVIRHQIGGQLKSVPYDMSDEFEDEPLVSQLRARATEKFNNEKPWLPSEGFDIDFAALWQTDEYKEFAPLQRVKLCDTVLVYFPAYGIEAVREKVVKTVYNVLLDRFDEIILNQLPATFSGIIS